MAVPPGPRAPRIVQTLQLLRNPLGFLTGLQRRFGPLFTVRFSAGEDAVYVAEPDLAREAFATDRTCGLAGEGRRRFLEPVVGENSLLTLDGAEWERQRKLLGPPFHGERIERFEGRIAEIAAADLERWPLGSELEIRPPMTRITLEVILRVVFGIADEARLDRLRELLPAMIAAGALHAWVPPGLRERIERVARSGVPVRLVPGGSFFALRRRVDEVLYAEIAERRADPGLDGGDVLSELLRARDEGGHAMTDVELRDELVTLLVAGHETTATGLAWAFERLARTPAAMHRLLAELDAGEDGYLDAVVRETLRVRPVVFDVVRVLTEPLEIGGYEVPAGWYLAPGIIAIHHLDGEWADPHAFRPERFADQRPNLRAWIPFGGGRRFCLGSHLALLEMRTILREVLSKVRVSAAGGGSERARVRHVTIQPSRGARVRVDRPAVRSPSRRDRS